MIVAYLMRKIFVHKKILLALAFIATPLISEAGMWHCNATSDSGAVWNWFGPTRDEARDRVEKPCEDANHGQYCGLICYPPKSYWRCLSHDTVPKSALTDPTKPKQGTWFWTSSEGKQIAINGARDACRHNSLYGGCYVDPNACSSSNPGDK